MTTSETDNFPDAFNAPGAGAPFVAQDLAATKRLLDQINVSAGNVSRTLISGFGAASSSGKSFNDVLSQIALSFAKMALRAGAKSLAEGLASGLSGLLSSAFAGGGGTIAPFAEGGVVASPTFFGNGASMGLMGERGAEAIMPLARGPDGRLGVVAQSAGAAARATSVTVNIAAQDVESFRRSETQITGALARAVARGQRSL
ncbi:MAG: phage tail tape measure protein [Methylocystis sp.]|nr:phage tail tape measure protein [Methylocystis sp.]